MSEPIFEIGFKVRMNLFNRFPIKDRWVSGIRNMYQLSNGAILSEAEIVEKHPFTYLGILRDRKKSEQQKEAEIIMECLGWEPISNIKIDKETGLYLKYEI